jgi:hypothetical protein
MPQPKETHVTIIVRRAMAMRTLAALIQTYDANYPKAERDQYREYHIAKGLMLDLEDLNESEMTADTKALAEKIPALLELCFDDLDNHHPAGAANG